LSSLPPWSGCQMWGAGGSFGKVLPRGEQSDGQPSLALKGPTLSEVLLLGLE